MAVYRLTPYAHEMDHPNWARSKYRSGCHVYAETEEDARLLAKREFDMAASEKMLGAPPLASPWTDPDLVECEEVAHIGGDEPPNGFVMIPDKQK